MSTPFKPGALVAASDTLYARVYVDKLGLEVRRQLLPSIPTAVTRTRWHGLPCVAYRSRQRRLDNPFSFVRAAEVTS